MNEKTIRQDYTSSFRGLNKTPTWIAGLILASYAAVILTAIALGSHLIGHHTNYAYATAFTISVVVATRLRGINNIVHECSHLTFTGDRKWNMIYGRIAAALILKSFEDYRVEHMTHHANLGDYEKDLDFQTLQDFRLEAPVTLASILRHIATPILGLHLTRYFSINLSQKDGFGYAIVKSGLIYSAIAFAWFDLTSALLLVALPYVWLFPAINYWTDCVDHAGLIEDEDGLLQSRNVKMFRPLRWLIFPRNDSYHLIHHLFPAVPTHHFDACHETLMGNPSYRARHDSPRSGEAYPGFGGSEINYQHQEG